MEDVFGFVLSSMVHQFVYPGSWESSDSHTYWPARFVVIPRKIEKRQPMYEPPAGNAVDLF